MRVIMIHKMQENMGDGVSYKPSKKDKSCADKPPALAVPFDFGAAPEGGRTVVGACEKGTREGDITRGGLFDPLLGVSKPMSTARSDAAVGLRGLCGGACPPNRSTAGPREIGRIPGGGGRSGAIGMSIADGRVVSPVDCGVRETALCGGRAPRNKGLPVGVGLAGSRGDSPGGVAGLGGGAGAIKEPKSFSPASPAGWELPKLGDRDPWIERGTIGAREVLLKG